MVSMGLIVTLKVCIACNDGSYAVCHYLSFLRLCISADAELESSVSLATSTMCQYASDVDDVTTSGSSFTASDLSSWLSGLEGVVAEPFRLSMTSAGCSISVMEGILRIGQTTNYLIDAPSMQMILDGADAVLSHEYYFKPDLQTAAEKSHLVYNMSYLFEAYCNLATSMNITNAIIGHPSYESIQGRLRVAAIVLPPGHGNVTEVYVPREAAYLHLPTPLAGPYCLVSYDAEAYEARMAQLLALESFAVAPDSFWHIAGNVSAEQRDGHFVMDLTVIEDPVEVIVDMFNVTCPANRTTNRVPCRNYTQYLVHCASDVGAWNYFCPQDSSSNMSCSRIVNPLQNVSTESSETCDVEFSLSYDQNASLSCVCRKASATWVWSLNQSSGS